MTTHVTLTDVMVDELVARAQKAEARAAALEAAIEWADEEFEYEGGDLARVILQRAEELLPTEEFLQKVRAL